MRAHPLLLAVTMVSLSPVQARNPEIQTVNQRVVETTSPPTSSIRIPNDLQVGRTPPAFTVGHEQAHHLLDAAAGTGAGPNAFSTEARDARNLNALLEPIREANRVPALACAVVLSNRIVGIGAVGVRKSGVPSAPVTLGDKWHQGSLTKSMTATLAAILVEEGRIRWSSTLAEVFPDWAPSMNATWRRATLEQLTSNRGGAPGDLEVSGIWTQLWSFQGTPRESRRFLLQKLTALPPRSEPGTTYEYSNAGFALAGHMLETVMNQPWEDLITARLFVPLGMTSAGFGAPAAPQSTDQPWGHQLANGTIQPIEPGVHADNPPAIGPAGTVHCSLPDLARYAAFHVHGHNQGSLLLPASTLVKLHTAYPNNANYAHGWIEVSRPWANPGKAYTHAGSNLQWYSVIWFAPAKGFAVVALCNMAAVAGPNPAATATDQIAEAMIREFLR